MGLIIVAVAAILAAVYGYYHDIKPGMHEVRRKRGGGNGRKL